MKHCTQPFIFAAAGMGDDGTLDNQHLEYEQFFVTADSVSKDQISSDHSSELFRVMAEHKSLMQKVNILLCKLEVFNR